MSSRFLANGSRISGLVRMGRKMTQLMRRMLGMARRRMTPANDAVQSAIFPQKMMEQQTSSSHEDSQEPDSRGLVHVITPSDELNSIHLSILPSFLSHLPVSIHTLQISFTLSQSLGRRNLAEMSQKLSHLSFGWVNNAVDKDGAINLHLTIDSDISVTFLDAEEHASTIERDVKSEVNSLTSSGDPYIRTFPFFRENAIFAAIASYSEHEECFLPMCEDESSSLPSLSTASIIQLSVPPPGVIPCSISRLPVELLSLIFSFIDDTSILGVVPDACKLWREVSAPYWGEPGTVTEKYERLKLYPGAGRMWDRLTFDESMDVGMVKQVIAGSPNVTEVWMDAFWNEEEANTVLNAIAGLKRVDVIRFGDWGLRKWRKEEIEKFIRRTGDRIRRLEVNDVEDSLVSASEGLHLSSRLRSLDLYQYPPLPLISLPRTLKRLKLTNMCPLPSSISECPLPPLLEWLNIELAPFSPSEKTSILPTPLHLSHLTHLTRLILDGGEETSNLISPEFFSTLKNATAIHDITLWYCVVDSFDFPDFIRWFFWNWQVSGAEKADPPDREVIGWHLQVRLFFGDWSKEEIVIARSTMEEYTRSEESGIWEPGEGEE
ncbi:hypothetical protein BT69DRAFT_1331540 [Atractiella rhizophila]|nr:hypothetical protein BT69DRAFT_1331540 [Atractiella rhizophila]